MLALAAFGLFGLLSALLSAADSQSLLLSELLAWSFIFAGTRLYHHLRAARTPDEEKDPASSTSDLHGEANYLAFAVLAAVVNQSLGNAHWVLPYVTPVVYYLLATERSLPWTLSNKTPTSPSAGSSSIYQTRKAAAYGVVAVGSSLVLLQSVSSLVFVPTACLTLLAQVFIFVSLGHAPSSDSPVQIMVSIEPIAGRVWAVLALLCVAAYQTFMPVALSSWWLTQIVTAGVVKAVAWLLLVLLTRQGHALAVSTLMTFAASTAELTSATLASQFGATAVVAMAAITQTAYLAPAGLTRKVVMALALLPLFAFLHTSSLTTSALDAYRGSLLQQTPGQQTFHNSKLHPIEVLSAQAEESFAQLLQRQSQTLSEAIAEYRRRYKRSPPPHFDTWFKLAQEAGLVLVDEFDGINKSLEPFWGLSPQRIRRDIQAAQSAGSLWSVEIKNHHMNYTHDGWMMAQIATWMPTYMKYLPDMNLTFNLLDEPRVFVPHANLEAALSKQLAHQEDLAGADAKIEPYHFVHIEAQPWWDLSTTACPIDSPSRQGVFQGAEQESDAESGISFVQNIDMATDVCQNQEYAQKHAFFSCPATLEFTDRLVPIFSQAKPNNWADILYPSPYYPDQADGHSYEPNLDSDWASKKHTIYWAGSTTGGITDGSNWNQQHRQRFVDLANGGRHRHVQYLEQDGTSGKWTPYNDTMAKVQANIDVKFTGLVQCTEDGGCDSLKEHFTPSHGESMSRSYESKLVMDVDGNSFSGRYWRLLTSKSAILKQAMFREWHDDWLRPWVHYVPVSVGMRELPETLRYLLQTEAGDARAHRIAEQGRAWAAKALRKRDVELVWFRLLLEYGRLVSDERESLQCCS